MIFDVFQNLQQTSNAVKCFLMLFDQINNTSKKHLPHGFAKTNSCREKNIDGKKNKGVHLTCPGRTHLEKGVRLTCPAHGVFWPRPTALRGAAWGVFLGPSLPCPKCGKHA